jgi:monoamine oxidase
MYSSSAQASAISQRAYEIQKVGLTCLVPEARGTVVVKIYNVAPKHGKGVFDLAAKWINDTTASQTFALAKILGLEVMIQNIDGDELKEKE